MKIFSFFSLLTVVIFFLACNNTKQDSTKTVVDTVKVIDTVKHNSTGNQPVKQKPSTTKTQSQPAQDKPVATPPAKPAPDWRAMMKEYHELLCKEHKGTGTTDDKIREVELGKELKDIPKTLNSDEKFYFSTEMVRTMNMETCN
jgi:hypothetical protein